MLLELQYLHFIFEQYSQREKKMGNTVVKPIQRTDPEKGLFPSGMTPAMVNK